MKIDKLIKMLKKWSNNEVISSCYIDYEKHCISIDFHDWQGMDEDWEIIRPKPRVEKKIKKIRDYIIKNSTPIEPYTNRYDFEGWDIDIYFDSEGQ